MILEEKSKTDVRLALDRLILCATDQMERELLREFSNFLADHSFSEVVQALRDYELTNESDNQ